MSWIRTDDNFDQHPKVLALRGDVLSAAARLAGLRARVFRESACCWSGRLNTDGVIPTDAVPVIATLALLEVSEAVEALELLVKVGLFEARPKRAGGGWLIHDWLDYNPARVQVESSEFRKRRNKALHNGADGKQIKAFVLQRDCGRCRYCGVETVAADRRSPARRTFDHVDPDGPNSIENVVVACGYCNRKKSDRTPDEAEMVLLAPGAGSTPRPEDRVSQPEDLRSDGSDRSMGTGRAGSGQVGSGLAGTGTGTGSGSGHLRVLSDDDVPPPGDGDYLDEEICHG